MFNIENLEKRINEINEMKEKLNEYLKNNDKAHISIYPVRLGGFDGTTFRFFPITKEFIDVLTSYFEKEITNLKKEIKVLKKEFEKI